MSVLVALVSPVGALVVAAVVTGYFALPPRHLRRSVTAASAGTS